MSRYRDLALENLELAHPEKLKRLRASGTLDSHLDSVESEAQEMYQSLLVQLRREKFDEKEENPLKRVQLLGQLVRQADEIVRAEVVQLPPDQEIDPRDLAPADLPPETVEE